MYLICEYDYLVPILTSLLYIGSFIGFFVIPYIADNYGRKKAAQIAWACFVIGVFIMGIADSPNMVGVGQFIAGFGSNPAITLCYSFINEEVLRKKRQYYGVMLQVFLAIGECIIGFLFMPKESWKWVILILFGLTVGTFFLLFYVEESPKYLLSRPKKEALKVLNNIARKNGKPPTQGNRFQ
jgi:OCT family organic cation transporter-like MFS transporter 4/5